jgi:hypothetical protein
MALEAVFPPATVKYSIAKDVLANKNLTLEDLRKKHGVKRKTVMNVLSVMRSRGFIPKEFKLPKNSPKEMEIPQGNPPEFPSEGAIVNKSRTEEKRVGNSLEAALGIGVPGEEREHEVENWSFQKGPLITPKVLLWYDYARTQGYSGSISDFIEECIELFFRSIGKRISIVSDA